jgi:DNA-binding XRE family transcriptional regulator
MANDLDISQELLSKIERGKDAPTIETLFLFPRGFAKASIGLCEEKGTSQTLRPVSLQRAD